MDDRDFLAERFEANRTHLRAVAYRMLGSVAEADDAVQEAWLRLSRSDAERDRQPRRLADDGRRPRVPRHAALARLPARGAARRPRARRRSSAPRTGSTPSTRRCWPTPSASRCSSCSRRCRPPSGSPSSCTTCSRCPFDEIAPIVSRSPAAARQLASRARRRVQGAAPVPDPDLRPPAGRRRRLPGRVARGRLRRARGRPRPRRRPPRRHGRPADPGREGGPRREAVARQALLFRNLAVTSKPALVNGAAGIVTTLDGEPFSVVGFTVSGGQDRRDGHPRRPGADPAARPGGARRLTRALNDDEPPSRTARCRLKNRRRPTLPGP